MNRKLHNSLMAVVASSALLVFGLLAAVPAQQSLVPHSMVVIADATPVESASLDDGAEAPRRKSHARGQTVQMPFFSFVPRG
jgi:hypothetical protein